MTTLPDLKICHKTVPKNSLLFDLNRFLYVGGAAINLKSKAAKQLIRGKLNAQPSLERAPLLEAIKEVIETELESGGSVETATDKITQVRGFYQFLDKQERPATIEALQTNYLDYAEHLFTRSHLVGASISRQVAYTYAVKLSSMFSTILGLPSSTKLILQTRLKYSNNSKKATGKIGEKQNLTETFAFGCVLVDLISGLSRESLHGPLPLRIPIRKGLVDGNEIILRGGNSASVDEWLSKPAYELTKGQKRHQEQAFKARLPVDRVSNFGRRALVNCRICAELMVFIAQTGMDLSTVKKLRRETYKYKPLGENYQVRDYKERRQGEVFFEIFKEYKPMLKRHLAFVDSFLPESEWLFPFFSQNGAIHNEPKSTLSSLRAISRSHGAPWIPPQSLKNTRVNYLLRRSGDEDLTAEMSQHGVIVLQQNYEKPSQQRAMIEVTRFWNRHDPIKKGDLKGSVLDGHCNGKPEPMSQTPNSVAQPDCVSPSGCLWCKRARDIDSEDYVWSLFSFRYLKTLEASLAIDRDDVPADLVINRLTEKIDWYRSSNHVRAAWVSEAEQKIEESDHHPHWSDLIEFLR